MYLVNGTTPVHIKLMKEKPTPAKQTTQATVSRDLQQEIYLRLIQGSAMDGKFDLGNLASANVVVKIADHLRGVSELLAASFEKIPAATPNEDNK